MSCECIPTHYGGYERQVPPVRAWTPSFATDDGGALPEHWYPADGTLWQDAGLTPVTSVGDVVGRMEDRAVSADHINQAVVANKPTLQAGPNSTAAIRFDGTNDYLQGAFTTGGSIAQPTTIFVVACLDTVATNDNITRVLVDGDDAGNRQFIYKANVTDPDEWRISAGSSVSSSTSATDDWIIWTVVFDGADSFAWNNGLLLCAGSAGANAIDGLTVGTNQGLTAYWDGDVAEVLIYAEALSTRDRNQVGQYLGTKYGLAFFTEPILPTVFSPIEVQNAIYDAPGGVAVVADNGDIVYVARRGTMHAVEAAGKLREWVSSDGGAWNQADIVDSANHDDRNPGGGIVPATGTILIFYSRYNILGGAWEDIRILRSTDHGATFTDEGTIVCPDTGGKGSYGQLVELPSGKLVKNFHGHNGVYRVFVQFSSDDGQTWGDEVVVYSGAALYVEGAMEMVSGTTDANSNLVIIVRNRGGVLHQFSSTDGGQSWTDDGDLPYSTGVDTDSAPWLYKLKESLILAFGDRAAGRMTCMLATATDVPGNVAAWSNKYPIYTQQAAAAENFGYPSMIKHGGYLQMFFYDAVGAVDPDIYTSC